MTAFSSDRSEALLQGDEAAALRPVTAAAELDGVYETERSAAFIRLHSLRTVALQFPDAMLGDAARVSRALEEQSSARCFLLGDSTYGSCCVDEVAAQHAGAEGLIHYGHACLSPARLLPVLRVFGRRPCDPARFLAAFRGVFPSSAQRAVVLADVQYEHAVDDLENILVPQYPHVRFARVESQPVDHAPVHGATGDARSADGAVRAFGRLLRTEAGSRLDDYSVFYVGRESITLTNFMMSWSNCEFFTYDPESGESRTASASTSRLVKRRYYLVERARDAASVGILVGTLGVAGFLEIIEQLKRALARAGKRCQVFVVGKPNPAKLANFPEIEVFVLVACPENSLLDCAEFYQPIVTPFEMEVACNRQRPWTGSFVSDFTELLPGYPRHVPLPAQQEEEEEGEGDVSLVTGAVRCHSQGAESPTDAEPTGALLLRGHNLQVASSQSAAGYLAARDWQGLEPRLGETRVSRVQRGRRGVAIAYEDEVTGAAT